MLRLEIGQKRVDEQGFSIERSSFATKQAESSYEALRLIPDFLKIIGRKQLQYL